MNLAILIGLALAAFFAIWQAVTSTSFDGRGVLALVLLMGVAILVAARGQRESNHQ